MTALTILTTEIRQLDGLYSLNDLHKAAGGKEKHAPTNFMRLDQTQALIDEICSADMQIIPVNKITGRGKQQGTYVCRELVYAYAMWINAKFHLQVIRAFDAQHAPTDRSEYLAEVRREFRKQFDELRKKYNYPRQLLGQPDFTSSEGTVRLDINMLANRKFISPLFALLNELRTDGHEVTAPLAEAEAMRQGIIEADTAFDQIWNIALKTKVRPAKISEKGKRQLKQKESA